MNKKIFKIGDIVNIKPFKKSFYGKIVKKKRGYWSKRTCEECGCVKKVYFETEYFIRIDQRVLDRIRKNYEKQHGKMPIINTWIKIASINKNIIKNLSLRNVKKL